jgi:hypothetical protein
MGIERLSWLLVNMTFRAPNGAAQLHSNPHAKLFPRKSLGPAIQAIAADELGLSNLQQRPLEAGVFRIRQACGS